MLSGDCNLYVISRRVIARDYSSSDRKFYRRDFPKNKDASVVDARIVAESSLLAGAGAFDFG